jgi:Flp pilus assembly protein TadD, contains TPR repeats
MNDLLKYIERNFDKIVGIFTIIVGIFSIWAIVQQHISHRKNEDHETMLIPIDDVQFLKRIDLKHPTKNYKKGLKHFKNKEYRKSINKFEKDITNKNEILSKDTAYAMNSICVSYTLLGLYDEAIKYSKEAEHMFKNLYGNDDQLTLKVSDNVRIIYNQYKNHEYDLELQISDINLNSNDIIAYLDLGISYHKLEKYNEAIKNYSFVINFNSIDPVAYHNRGLAYAELGEQLEAINDYTMAIELDPNFSSAYHNRGLAYAELGKQLEAINDYTMAIELDPNYAVTYNNRGVVYSCLQKYTKAIRDYTKAIKLDKYDAIFYNNRGDDYSILGKYTKAQADFDMAHEIDPINF